MGEDSAALLGSLLVTTVRLAAFSRADIPEEKCRPFLLYLDQFQNFTTAPVATMISGFVVRNVGALITFCLGPTDGAPSKPLSSTTILPSEVPGL